MRERIQKIIAEAGICSRRHAESLILSGCVSVNGKMETTLGTKADPEVDYIKVNGKLLHTPPQHIYVLLNKPKGVVSTAFDPEGRTTVTELIRGVQQRIYPVGRLDYNTEGLLLLTNDGDFAQIVMKAGVHCPKTYLAKVRGTLGDEALERLRKGIVLDRVRTAPARIIPVRKADNSWYEVTLTEGRNQQIRKMFEFAGHPVEKLKRTRIGFLEDSNLRPGKYRSLTPQEVARFKKMRMKSSPGPP
ncbi:MAG: rRNA pseudouridine synthase [Acidobacteriia bacterium]|nr:rRNA pseudouridine synthase [Terriglobia bacterium]